MRLGCCGKLDQAVLFRELGFDFIEVNVQQVLQGDVPSSEWDKTAPDPQKLALPVEAANCLVPAHHPIVGPKRDMKVLQDYMQRIAKRAGHMGMKRLVFGSGGARKRPDEVDVETANEQLLEFTRMAGEMCAHHDVLLVIEHLNKGETNTINALSQSKALCDKAAHRSVAVLVDSFHYGLEKEEDGSILGLGDRIRHVHVAEPVKRIQPGGHGPVGSTPDAFDFEHFFALLRKVGYDERVAIESSWTGPIEQTAPGCVAFLRETWAKAGKVEA